MRSFSLVTIAFAGLVPVMLKGQFGNGTLICRSEISAPSSLKTLDVDGDGDRDLIVGSNAAATQWGSRTPLVLFRNGGNGSFGPMQVIDSTARNVTVFVLSDLDQDGDSDIVVIQSGLTEDTTAWYENLGGGSFGSSQSIAYGAFEWNLIAAGDMDGDGDADVLDSYGASILWHENNGNGTFTNTHVVLDNMFAASLSLKDIDSDGDLDVLFGRSSYTQAYASINDGSGGFGQPNVLYDGVDSWIGTDLGIIPMSLNGDARLDLITFQENWGHIITHISSAPLSYYSVETVSSSGAVFGTADVDHDGRIDLLGVNDTCIGWWRNVGNGIFDDLVRLLPLEMNYSAIETGVLEDLDGDGDGDLAYVDLLNDQVFVHLNDGNNVFDAGTGLAYAMGLDLAALSDMDGDGDLDVVYPACGPYRIGWRPNDGGGHFGAERSLGPAPSSTFRVKLADVEPDGDQDLLVASGTKLLLYRNDGAGSATIPVIIDTTGSGNSFRFGIGDIDEDGDQDVIAYDPLDSSLHWRLNNGSTFIAGTVVTDTLSNVEAGACEDLNGDGAPDLAVVTASPNLLSLFLNDGSGGFLQPIYRDLVSTGFINLQLEDLDMDGDRDVLVSNGSYMAMVIIENLGDGHFSEARTFAFDGGGGTGIALGDIDQDGDPDLVCSEALQPATSSGLVWRENLGHLQFGDGMAIPSTHLGPTSLAIGDMDGDALPDLLTMDSRTDQLLLYRNRILETERVSGHVFWDVDSNGVAGPDEPGIPYVRIATDPDMGSAYTDANGDFVYYFFSTPLNIHAELDEAWVLSTDSANYHLLPVPGGPDITDLDFGYKSTPTAPDLRLGVNLMSHGCGTDSPTWLSITNRGSSPVDVVAQLLLDPGFAYVPGVGLPPDSISNGAMYWSADSLLPGNHMDWRVAVHTPGADSIGLPYDLKFTVFATDLGGEDSTFIEHFDNTVSCSYDPNSKNVQPMGKGDEGYVDISQSRLTYTIHFQNTGNDTAHTVVVRDELGPDLLHGSLEVMASSHPFALGVEADGQAIFTFNNIALPDSMTDPVGSQGYVTFRVGLKQGLASGTLITNTAAIYFDNNAPVLTNEVRTTLWDCSLFVPLITEGPLFVLNAPAGVHYQWFLNGDTLIGSTSMTVTAVIDGEYSVLVVDSVGCSALSEPHLVLGASIKECGRTSMSVSPNPGTTSFEITFDKPIGTSAELVLSDMTGRSLRDIPVSGQGSLHLERGNLSDGLYHATLMVEGVPVSHLSLMVR